MLKCGFSVFTSIAGAGFIAFNSFSILVRATIDVIYQEKISSVHSLAQCTKISRR